MLAAEHTVQVSIDLRLLSYHSILVKTAFCVRLILWAMGYLWVELVFVDLGWGEGRR